MPGFRSAAAFAGLALQAAAPSAWLLSCVVVVAASSTGPAPAFARDYALHDLRIDHPYARPTPPGATTGGAYLTIRNTGLAGDRLVHVASPVATSAEVHSMTVERDVMRMRAVPSLDIPSGATVTLRPGGYHVMLVGLARPLAKGDKVPLTLTFEKAGTVDVTVDVETDSAGAVPAHAH